MVMNPEGRDELSRDVRIRYATAVLLGVEDTDRFEWPDWLAYSAEPVPGARIRIVPSGFFGPNYGQPESLPDLPLKTIDELPLLYGEPSVQQSGDELVVLADLVASSYALLTRYEEFARRDVRDEHGRFPGKESLPYRAGFIDTPLVDEYSCLLRRWAEQAGIEFSEPNRRFKVSLTHDIDSLGLMPRPLQSAREMAKAMLGRQTWRDSTASALISAGFKSDPFYNLAEVVSLDRLLSDRVPSESCSAEYYFLSGSDSPYDLTHPRIQAAVECVRESGALIGLHTGYEGGEDPTLVRFERERLEEATGVPIHANRHHYLAWREPEHGHEIAASGIRRDSTMGYADVAGFRLGVCRPIPLFDPVEQRLFGIQEHPLVVMDCTLSFPKYMNLEEEVAFEYAVKLAEATYRHQGEYVMLWHNTMLARNDGGYNKQLYLRLLDRLADMIQGG